MAIIKKESWIKGFEEEELNQIVNSLYEMNKDKIFAAIKKDMAIIVYSDINNNETGEHMIGAVSMGILPNTKAPDYFWSIMIRDPMNLEQTILHVITNPNERLAKAYGEPLSEKVVLPENLKYMSSMDKLIEKHVYQI